MIEKRWLLKKLEKSRFISHIYVLLLVTVSFVIFNASDMGAALACIGDMLGLGGLPAVSAEALYCLKSYGFTLAIAALGATELPLKAIARLKKQGGERLVSIAELPVLALLLLTVTAFLVDGSFNPFLYFRF